MSLKVEDIYYRVNPRLTQPGEKPVKLENIEDEAPTPLFQLAEELPDNARGVEGVVSSWSNVPEIE
ncbi:MAG: hypothetical protein KDD01_12275 [Phaeodactylibacter sp.]|nr:hypothetical protein [Phaeodactylibacter sp.]